MQDYPMRGRSCLLFIKKRRWFNHSTGKYVSRNWKLVAEGTLITTELAFLLPLRYDFSTQDFGMIHEKVTKRHILDHTEILRGKNRILVAVKK